MQTVTSAGRPFPRNSLSKIEHIGHGTGEYARILNDEESQHRATATESVQLLYDYERRQKYGSLRARCATWWACAILVVGSSNKCKRCKLKACYTDEACIESALSAMAPTGHVTGQVAV